MKLCLVTAFLDIGRSDWTAFKRNTLQYFSDFSPYLSLDHEMVVYIDVKFEGPLRSLLSGRKNDVTVIPVDQSWLKGNIHAWSRLEREREIMNDEDFKRKISHRSSNPECCRPEYNTVQHAKIDFVMHAVSTVRAEVYAWTDFGFFQDRSRIPRAPLDLSLFDLSHINFQSMSEIRDTDFDVERTLRSPRDLIGGFFYLGTPRLLEEYQALYHSIVDEFHSANVVDDDQHVMLQAVRRRPDLFRLWNLGAWHMVYIYFQKR